MSDQPIQKTENFISIVIVVVAMFIFLIIGSYVCNFGAYDQSDDPDRWGVFGDYIGGTMNTLFGLANLVVLTFLTLQIVKIEDERNKNNYKNSVHPAFCVSSNINHDETIKVTIDSFGLGTVIIKNFKIETNDGIIFNSFYDFFDSINSLNIDYNTISIITSTISDRPIIPGTNVQIIEIKVTTPTHSHLHPMAIISFEQLRLKLAECKLILEYTDIFEVDIKIKEEDIQVNYI